MNPLRAIFGRQRGEAPERRGATRVYRAGLEAGSGGRRWDEVAGARDPAGMAHMGAATVAARAAERVANDPVLARAKESLVGSLVGTGITPRPQHPDAREVARLVRAFGVWSAVADADGLLGLQGLIAAVVGDLIVFGESVLVWGDDPETGAPKLRRLHPDQLDRSRTTFGPSPARIVEGVEFDANGRRAAYWIFPGGTADRGALRSLASVRAPAGDVIHMFRPLFPGQIRGLSWFAPVLLSALELHGYYDATLQRARLGAASLGTISLHPEWDARDVAGAAGRDPLPPPVIPQASFLVLEPGEQAQFRDVPDVGDVDKFASAMLRQIAAGLGLTFEQLSGDYSKVNYSSARAATLEFRRFARGVQEHVIIHQLCRPVWDRFVRHQVLTGAVGAAAYQADPSAWHAVRWLPPHWPSVDPVKDAESAVLELSAGLRSRADLVAERGGDVVELDQQIAADQARADALGLRLTTQAPTAAPPAADQEGQDA